MPYSPPYIAAPPASIPGIIPGIPGIPGIIPGIPGVIPGIMP